MTRIRHDFDSRADRGLHPKAGPRARTRAIAAGRPADLKLAYFSLMFLFSAMFVFMLMIAWAAGV